MRTNKVALQYKSTDRDKREAA